MLAWSLRKCCQPIPIVLQLELRYWSSAGFHTVAGMNLFWSGIDAPTDIISSTGIDADTDPVTGTDPGSGTNTDPDTDSDTYPKRDRHRHRCRERQRDTETHSLRQQAQTSRRGQSCCIGAHLQVISWLRSCCIGAQILITSSCAGTHQVHAEQISDFRSQSAAGDIATRNIKTWGYRF